MYLEAEHNSGELCCPAIVLIIIITFCFIESHVFNTNSVDPDQMPHSVALIWVCTVCLLPFLGFLGSPN